MSYWNWNDYVDIDVDVDDIINDIPTSVLEEELAKRKEQMEDSLKTFQAEEKFRKKTLTITIDPGDYNLINSEDAQLSDFSNSEIVSYLIEEGYTIICGKHMYNANELANQLYEMPRYKFKNIMCDALGISQVSSKEEVLNKLKEKLS